MAKRSTIEKSDKITLKQVKQEAAESDEMVRIRLTIDVVKNVYISGKRLTWNGAGSEQLVSRSDADILLSKVRSGGCEGCGFKTYSIFEEVI